MNYYYSIFFWLGPTPDVDDLPDVHGADLQDRQDVVGQGNRQLAWIDGNFFFSQKIRLFLNFLFKIVLKMFHEPGVKKIHP